MKCFTYVFLFFCLVAPSTLGIAQVAPAANPTVAYIYVSHSLSDSNSEVIGFAVDATGALSRIAGSPFPANVQQMALNGKYLFGDQNGIDIVSFQIAATGQLRQVASFDDSSHGSPQALFLDHTGATLYAEDFNAEGTGNNGYQFFRINGTTGQLSLIGLSTANTENGIPMVFSANNQFAYSANCVHGDSTVFGFSRNADGSLTRLNITPPIPTDSQGVELCPFLAAADPTNLLAVSMFPNPFFAPPGPPQLAVYSIAADGSLTTNSTAANMPQTAVTEVTSLRMAPSGQLLAVAGTTGLEVFHMNGANPITPYTGLLTNVPVDQMFWDNADHLFAISRSGNRLFVFTITPTSFAPGPNSPLIGNPQGVIVLPRT